MKTRNSVLGAIVLILPFVNTISGEIISPEVVDEIPSITNERALEWSEEFFRSIRSAELSNFKQLESHIYQVTNLESEIDNGNEKVSSSNRSGRRLERILNHPHSQSQKNQNQNPSSEFSSNSRINTRHYDFPMTNSLTNTRKSPTIKLENLEWMLKHVFIYPRSHVTNETAKEMIKNYISDSFQLTSGLHTSVQKFKPLQFLSMYEGSTLPTGANIIAVIKGTEWSTSYDRPIVIGAHWDTVNFTPGTDDNGSGVASMLEAARAISHSGCRPKYSIIFVAFDLEEVGSQGSLVFIKDYLVKILQTNLPSEVTSNKFQGAFIMDTIMNFNESEGSQTFPTDWSLVIPDVYEQVANENYVGDFLSMIYRYEVDFEMADKFKIHWAKSTHETKYKLKEFPLVLKAELPDLEVLSGHLNFLRSDHARFWYMNDTEIPFTFNAVLMTDTGPYRGNMRACYHTVCDGPEVSVYNNPKNMKFLAKVTQALVDTTVDMSECRAQDLRMPMENLNSINKRIGTVNNNAPRRYSSPLRNLVNLLKWIQT